MARLKGSDKDDLVSEVKNKFEKWRMFKLPFEGNMFLNLAFYYGFQWTLYNIVTAELSEADNPAGNIRLVSNQIQPRIRTLHSKMTKNRPIIEAVPVGFKDQAIYSANLSNRLLEQFRQDHDEEDLDAETVDWLLICGDVYRKVGFDPTEGEVATVNPDSAAEALNMTQQEDGSYAQSEEEGESYVKFGKQGAQFPIGELFDEVVPPFEVYFPTYASSYKTSTELMHVKLMEVSAVKEKWGKRAANVAPSANINMGSYFQRRLLGMANPDIGSSSGIAEALQLGNELCYVVELWKKPCKNYPRGYLTIEAGDQFLYGENNPYYETFKSIPLLKGGIPFIHFGCINAPGRIWSISPVEAMRPIQVEYNKTISDIVQNRATLGRNKIISPKTANIDSDAIANIHGQHLEYSGIMPPQMFPAAALPQQVERETERNRQDLDTISGSHEVSRAEVPSGVKSGIAINYLLEQDDTIMAPIIHSFERAKQKLAIAKLAIAKTFYKEDRIIQTANTDDPAEIISFTGSDLSTNIRVTPGSALPKSRAALQATIMDLWDRHAILDDGGMPDAHKLFDLLRTSMGIDAFSESENLDLGRARRENLLLTKGMQIVPEHYENHIIHIKEHNRFRKTEQFYKFPQEIKKMFDFHVAIHMLMLAPPTATPGAPESAMLQGLNPPGGPGGGPPRRSPSTMGQGVMGALNNPPGNPGGTMPGE